MTSFTLSSGSPIPINTTLRMDHPKTERAVTSWPTISAAVRGADWVICSVPDRLELIQMVLKRAQAEAPRQAIVAVASPGHDVDSLQACAMRPGQVVRLVERDTGGVALDVTERNAGEVKQVAEAFSAELAALRSLVAAPTPYSGEADAESA